MRYWQSQRHAQRVLYDRRRAREQKKSLTPATVLRRAQVTPRHEYRPQVLRFTPYAWAKLLWFRDRGPTEIGGFGISAATPGDLLLVEDFVTVAQQVSAVSVAFNDEAVADHFENQAAAGRPPERVGRIWLHTHPGDSPQPSGVDEETFERVFGRCHWALMFILARGGDTYARLRFGVGPGAQVLIAVQVDYRQPFVGSDVDAWEAEYQAHVSPAARGQMPTDFDMLDEIAWNELSRPPESTDERGEAAAEASGASGGEGGEA